MKSPPAPQLPLPEQLPRTTKEVFAEALKSVERELREAQDAFANSDSNDVRARYAKARLAYDQFMQAIPWQVAGASSNAEA